MRGRTRNGLNGSYCSGDSVHRCIKSPFPLSFIRVDGQRFPRLEREVYLWESGHSYQRTCCLGDLDGCHTWTVQDGMRERILDLRDDKGSRELNKTVGKGKRQGPRVVPATPSPLVKKHVTRYAIPVFLYSNPCRGKGAVFTHEEDNLIFMLKGLRPQEGRWGCEKPLDEPARMDRVVVVSWDGWRGMQDSDPPRPPDDTHRSTIRDVVIQHTRDRWEG